MSVMARWRLWKIMSVSMLSGRITQMRPRRTVGLLSESVVVSTAASAVASAEADPSPNNTGAEGRVSGVAITPATADAATTAGEARYTSPLPCLPAKFRLPVLTVTSPGPF